MSRNTLIVTGGDADHMRIDSFMASNTGITRSRIKRLLEGALVHVNGAVVKANYKIRPGDRIEFAMPEDDTEKLAAEDIPLDILFMDSDLAVISKPAGMVVYPAAGHTGGTLMNALAFHAPYLATVGGPLRPGVVHRLDRDTSGIMVVALNDKAYYALLEEFRQRTVGRRYMAIVYGRLSADKGEIDLRIGRSPSDRKKMSTRSRRGKEALTSWEAVERLHRATLIHARLSTGRTHQIRVHLAAIGHAVLGDPTYGKKTRLEVGGTVIRFPRQMLHAEFLSFIHPSTGKKMEFKAPIPEDMKDALIRLRG